MRNGADKHGDTLMNYRVSHSGRQGKRGFFRAVYNLLLYVACVFFAVVGIGGACLFFALYFFSESLPNHTELKNYSPQIASRVFLQNGDKLCEYANERRYFVPIDRIPSKVINAFISVEDKHFYQHEGVDFAGIVRSLVTNVKHIGEGKRPQGASTITQQVARIFLIKSNKVSYLRKIEEFILAYRIEHSLTKKQILELYLNQIYLGIGSYGVAAAATTYFDKTLDELTIGECAYLACLAKGANNYHPVKNKEKAISRRNWAISRMLANGYISQEEANDALKENLQLVPKKSEKAVSEYFAEEVRKNVMSKYPLDSINSEGLIIRTTLDINLQRIAYNSLRKHLEKLDRSFGWRGPLFHIDDIRNKNEILKILHEVKVPNGGEDFDKAVLLNFSGNILVSTGDVERLDVSDFKWARGLKTGDVFLVKKSERLYKIHQLPQVQGGVVVLDVNTGRVLAMQGGYSFAQSEFNRVTQALRQVGSAFKPFVYLAGLENGFAPNSIIDASAVEIDLGPGQGVWTPRNYKGVTLGDITFREAIERSVNTATVRIAKEVGMEKIAAIAKQFDIFDSIPPYFSYAIGAGETTLMRLTSAYAMLANGGKRITPTLIDYIEDKTGKVIYRADTHFVVNENSDDESPKLNDMRGQVLNEQSIYQINSLLEGVMQRGSGASSRILNIPVAGKTGTSNESKDTWFIGYTPDIVVGVFIGFDDHTKSLGKNASGTATALPVFIDFMQEAKKYFQPKPFKVPTGITLRNIDAKTGGEPHADSIVILEAFKKDEDLQRNILNRSSYTEDLVDEESENSTEVKQVFGVY